MEIGIKKVVRSAYLEVIRITQHQLQHPLQQAISLDQQLH